MHPVLLSQAPQWCSVTARCTSADDRQPWPTCSASSSGLGASPLRLARPGDLQACTATPSSVPPLETQGPGGGSRNGAGGNGSGGFSSGGGAGEGDEDETLLSLEQVLRVNDVSMSLRPKGLCTIGFILRLFRAPFGFRKVPDVCTGRLSSLRGHRA